MTVYQVLTSRIIEALEKGVIPWRRPWNGGAGVRNGVSKRPYRGVNVFMLMACSNDTYFFTQKQIKALGGRFNDWKNRIPVVLWNWIEKTDSSGKVIKRIPFARYYCVWGLSDTIGMKWKAPETASGIDFKPLERCEAFIKAQGAKITHKGDRAFYIPSSHEIFLPPQEVFKSVEEYYCTNFHEHIHWKAKDCGVTLDNRFGDERYSREELIAELGAMFSAHFCGVDISETFDNSVGYLQEWLKKLKGDPNLIVFAASQAQKRFDAMAKVFDPKYGTQPEEPEKDGGEA